MEQRFKGNLSDEYDLNKKVYPHQEKNHIFVAKSIRDFNKKNNAKVLEIGCGTGETTKEIKNYNEDINLVLLDSSKSMIEQAKKNSKSWRNGGRLEFKEEDALTYLESCKDNEFDIIFSGYTIHNLVKNYRSKVLKEIFRVLKEEGIFINEDIIYSSNKNESINEFRWLAEQLNKYSTLGREDLKDKWLNHITEDRNSDRILIEDEYITELLKLGFKDVHNLLRFHSDAIIIAKK
jgi:ubiquinone/menaquinone biosynthesis C-methylase UbiE